MVDDDIDVQATMAHTFSGARLSGVTASSTATAMPVCQQQERGIDALVTDLSLPGEAAGQLARVLSAAYPSTKIVYASGIPRHIALSSGLVRSDAPYVEKPVDPRHAGQPPHKPASAVRTAARQLVTGDWVACG
ncbi:response regulator [Paractinoplanes rishiriensis]|uniref:response regulator n=1 Tax=Paractinoplanes rishiriensis TaxID=1050105 RepID=UPI0019451140|nr:response regulator [Actinoplanes rishiriensis]